jgi:hypothetical protein
LGQHVTNKLPVKIRLDEVKPKQIVGDAPGVVIIGSSIVLSVKKPAALKIMFFELIVILIVESISAVLHA